jgi:hypothetical protein
VDATAELTMLAFATDLNRRHDRHLTVPAV